MVAKKEDGTVVKKLFKPIEDSVKEGMDSRNNIFVLSKNKVMPNTSCINYSSARSESVLA